MSLPANTQRKLLVPKYTPAQLETRLTKYWTDCDGERNDSGEWVRMPCAPTYAGAASALGLSRKQLDCYWQGQINSPMKDAYAQVVEMFRTDIEAYLEGMLTRERGSPSGAIFALESNFGWRRTVNIEVTEKPKLVIHVQGELAAMLKNDDSPIEGVFSQVDDSPA